MLETRDFVRSVILRTATSRATPYRPSRDPRLP